MGCRRGAIAVLTPFFACFMAACLFALFATIDTLHHREHLQDAADATSFLGAVVHAKGMNLIVLIHVVMAVLLAIYVGLRLVETVGIVASGICTALAVPTYGASLAFVPTIADLTNTTHDLVEDVKDVLDDVLPTLHDAAEGVAELLPVVASVRSFEAAESHYGVLGVAIPPSVSMPVENDDFAALCRKAGDYTGNVVAIPFAMIPPVRSGVDSMVEAIVSAGPSWFCGGGEGQGAKPALEHDPDAGWVALPEMPNERDCKRATSELAADEGHTEQYKSACAHASAELLAATPARDGGERAGEPLCPTNCRHSSNPRCPPGDFPDCAPDAPQNAAARELWGHTNVPHEHDAPYWQRAAAARAQCVPGASHGQTLRGHTWVERTETHTHRFERASGRWWEDRHELRIGPKRLERRDQDDGERPCGQGGAVGSEFVHDPAYPLCRGNVRCLASAEGAHDGPCSRSAPAPGAATTLVEEEVVVLELLGCGYRERRRDAEVPDVDVSSEVGGDGDSVPLKLRDGVELGGDELQVRGVVLGDVPSVHHLELTGRLVGERTVERGALADVVARVGVAQAEYYFDDSKLGGTTERPLPRSEWLWNMGWTARLRPFRLSSGQDDDEGERGGAEGGAGEAVQGAVCDAVGSGCSGLMDALHLLGGDP
jgi:hypothetical protein